MLGRSAVSIVVLLCAWSDFQIPPAPSLRRAKGGVFHAGRCTRSRTLSAHHAPPEVTPLYGSHPIHKNGAPMLVSMEMTDVARNQPLPGCGGYGD